jgi:hypothetical protein
MKVALSAGQTSDYRGYDALTDSELPAPKVLIADKGYDSNAIRDQVAAQGGTPVIPAPPQPIGARADQRPGLRPAQSYRALHQPSQKRPTPRHPLRQDLHKPSRLHRDHFRTPLVQAFVNMT